MNGTGGKLNRKQHSKNQVGGEVYGMHNYIKYC